MVAPARVDRASRAVTDGAIGRKRPGTLGKLRRRGVGAWTQRCAEQRERQDDWRANASTHCSETPRITDTEQ